MHINVFYAKCMEACPYDARFVDDTMVAVDKCTFCDHRSLVEGGTTACQATCPTKVRTFGDLDDENSDIVASQNKTLLLSKRTHRYIAKTFLCLLTIKAYAKQSVSHNTIIHMGRD